MTTIGEKQLNLPRNYIKSIQGFTRLPNCPSGYFLDPKGRCFIFLGELNYYSLFKYRVFDDFSFGENDAEIKAGMVIPDSLPRWIEMRYIGKHSNLTDQRIDLMTMDAYCLLKQIPQYRIVNKKN